MIEVNLTAPIALMDRMRGVMGPGGAIVNISSLNAVRPPMGAAVYTATKGGLDAATAAFARELGPLGIRVNAVAPGLIEKPEAPRPAEIVEMVVKETPLGPHRHARGYRGGGGVPPVGGCGVHHRAGPGGQRGIPVVTRGRSVTFTHAICRAPAASVVDGCAPRIGARRTRGLPRRARGLCRGAGGGGRRRHRAGAAGGVSRQRLRGGPGADPERGRHRAEARRAEPGRGGRRAPPRAGGALRRGHGPRLGACRWRRHPVHRRYGDGGAFGAHRPGRGRGADAPGGAPRLPAGAGGDTARDPAFQDRMRPSGPRDGARHAAARRDGMFRRDARDRDRRGRGRRRQCHRGQRARVPERGPPRHGGAAVGGGLPVVELPTTQAALVDGGLSCMSLRYSRRRRDDPLASRRPAQGLSRPAARLADRVHGRGLGSSTGACRWWRPSGRSTAWRAVS
jgi:hypothetical protein